MIKDFIIIGAGLSGLNLAHKINQLKLGSLHIIEKSRGIGGRLATRRTLSTRFDHGAQFYRLKEDIATLHEFWGNEDVNTSWFQSLRGNHWCAKLGMTALAKSLAKDKEITLEKQISSIHFENGLWKIISSNNENWYCRNLILTCPLPQSLKLLEGVIHLENFDLNKFELLKKIEYTKALIALITFEDAFHLNDHGYEEFETGDIFSIADQMNKGVSEISALTLTMSPKFSEIYFEREDQIILTKILDIFSNRFPNNKIKASELKKWRYCKPISQVDNLYSQIAPSLYLIGDAFGGSSLLGAVRSSEALCQYLYNK